jgi:hypothetical protein
LQQVLNYIVSGFVNVRVDAVSRQVPSLGGKANTDIAADLSDPHALVLEAQRRKPEPQMEALID